MATDPTTGGRDAEINLPGGSLTLKKLCPADFISLSDALTSDRKASLVTNAKAAALSPVDTAKMLNQFDARPLGWSDFIAWINSTIPGRVKVIECALAKSGKTWAALEAIGCGPYDYMDVACKVAGLERADPLPAGATGETDPAPTGTGEPKPA